MMSVLCPNDTPLFSDRLLNICAMVYIITILQHIPIHWNNTFIAMYFLDSGTISNNLFLIILTVNNSVDDEND